MTKKDEILNAATELFAERGSHRVSMQDIADSLNRTKPYIYYYWDNKAAIIEALHVCLAGALFDADYSSRVAFVQSMRQHQTLILAVFRHTDCLHHSIKNAIARTHARMEPIDQHPFYELLGQLLVERTRDL